MKRKIKLSESDLYNIIKQVLLEQEEDENVWNTDEEEFNFRLFKAFDGDSEKFAKYHNKFYEKIVVDGDLNLSNTPITSLPDNLHVGGYLDLYRCKNLTSLPDNLHVGGYLDLVGTPITSLGDNLSVGGYLDLNVTPIEKLPNNLKVFGDLWLQSTNIKTLPDDLKVKFSIFLFDTPLSKNKDLFVKYNQKHSHRMYSNFATFRDAKKLKNEFLDYDKFTSELGEQSTEGGKPSYPAVTKWETGVKRGPANSIDPKQKWSDTYQTKRGKANTIDQKSKWSTGLTRGKANTLL
jgi:hypothetical protein